MDRRKRKDFEDPDSTCKSRGQDKVPGADRLPQHRKNKCFTDFKRGDAMKNPYPLCRSGRSEESSLFFLSLRANAFVFCERGNPSLSVQGSGQVLKQEAFQ